MSHAANNTTPSGSRILPAGNISRTSISTSPEENSASIAQAVTVSQRARFSSKLTITAQLADGAMMP